MTTIQIAVKTDHEVSAAVSRRVKSYAKLPTRCILVKSNMHRKLGIKLAPERE